MRVLIADDHALFRDGLRSLLEARGVEVVGEARNGNEAITLARKLGPDVVLMDVRMPGMNGIEATRIIAERHPSVRVLVLTTFDLDEYAIEAVEAGASGFLLKDARAAELIRAVRAVADGDPVMAASVTQRLMLRLGESRPAAARLGIGSAPAEPARERLEQLTEREREVFALIAKGLSNAEIGEHLFLSESTVKTHVGRVLAKLQLRDRVHAVILAYETGSITTR